MVAKTGDSKDIRAVKADDGVELHYEVLGDGPPVVLLHGVLVGRFAFSRMREALSENYQMILPSSRGHDGTEMTFPADYGFATSEVRDLSAIMAAEGLDQVHLVGHSSGGATAFAFARDCPERVDRLVLIEPTLVNAAEAADMRPYAAELRRNVDTGKANGDMAALRICMEYTGGDAWAAMDEATKSNRLERMAPMAPLVAPHHQIMLDFAVTEADLQGLQPPTLLIYGTHSFEFEPLIAAAWRRHRPDLALITVEGAGHNVHHDSPDIVNPEIISFLGGDLNG